MGEGIYSFKKFIVCKTDDDKKIILKIYFPLTSKCIFFKHNMSVCFVLLMLVIDVNAIELMMTTEKRNVPE